ncbi:Mce protein [Mycobacterium sp. NPDC003323]
MTVTTDKKCDGENTTPADESEVEAAAEAEAETDTETTRPGRRRLVIAAAAVTVAALLGGSGFLGWLVWQDHRVDQAAQQARDAAVAYAPVLTSIDSDKVDENFDQVLAGATGEFKDMYSESSMQLRQLLIDNKASAHGVVVESAVQSASPDQVVVLLFVDQSVTNSTVPDPRIDRSRIKMTMDKVDGQWRASKVELP